MSWGMVAVAAASVVGGAMQANSAKKAAKAANKGADAGIEEQRRQFDTFQGNINPYLDFGKDQLDAYGRVQGGDYSGFMNDPSYLYARDAAFKGLDAGAASRGNLWGGGTDADRMALGQGLATQNLNNYMQRMQWGAQLGQNSAVGAGQMGQSNADAISGLYGQIGQNNSNSAINQSNAWGNALGGVSNAAGMYYGNRKSSYQ